MKLRSFALPAVLATSASASEHSPVEAYLLSSQGSQSKSESSSPFLSNDVAHAVVQQRLSSSQQQAPLGDWLSHDEEAITYINDLGKPSRPLFDNDADEPHQLVISLSSVTTETREALKDVLPAMPLAFTAEGLPAVAFTKTRQFCTFDRAINPKDKGCWNGKTQYLNYDATDASELLTLIGDKLATLKTQATKGQMETLLVLSEDAAPLERRLVVEEVTFGDETATTQDDDDVFISSSKPAYSSASSFPQSNAAYDACYSTYDACMEATGDCFEHGKCMDRWLDPDASCFSCKCYRYGEKDEEGNLLSSHTWGGAACQKRNVSVQFWLFFGVTLALMATVAFSISLLFSIGEEKLPGVIGAGVSRTK